MKPKHFALLAVAALVSLAAAIAVYSSSTPWSDETAGGAALFPGLKTNGARVARIEIAQGSTTLALAREGEQWRLENRGGYPATPEKLRAFLTNLTDAALAEPKTRNPDRYSLLDLDDPKGEHTSSRLVRVLDDKGEVLAEAVIGKTRAGAGSYVRKPDDPQTWLVTTDLSGGIGLRDWAKARIFETAADKITKLKIELPGEAAYEIVRGADGQHALSDIPAGKKLKFVNAIDNILEASAFMDFDDVRKAGEATGDVSTATLETETGLKVTYTFHRTKDATWLTIQATGEGAAKQAAEDIAARTNGWEFKILPSKADATLKRRDDLLEDSSS